MAIWALVRVVLHVDEYKSAEYFSQMKSYCLRIKRSLLSMAVVSLPTPSVLTVQNSSDSPNPVYLSSILTEPS